MRNWILALALLLPLSTYAADTGVDPAVASQIRKAIPDLKIDEIRTSPIRGLYELKVGRNIFYADKDGSHLISGGHIFETASHRDITRERLEEINRINWNILPLDKAIVSGDKNAKLKLAVFTDPDCPYCKKLEQELNKVQGIRVYTFLFPLTMIHPTSRTKAEAIWCSKNRHKALIDVMLHKAELPAGKCTTPIDDIHALATKLGIGGTPTMIAGDGRMYAGLKTGEELKAWLEDR